MSSSTEYLLNAGNKGVEPSVSIARCNNYKSKLQLPLKKNILESFEATFFGKLYNFQNFIGRRLSDHNKITFALKYLLMFHLG